MNQDEAFEDYRALLFSIAYRMTGSASDAEDLVQEAYLRYQASATQEIISVKAYLTTIITRLALDHLKSARVTREHYVGAWLPEPLLTSEESSSPQAHLEQQEALSLSFLRLLETLNPPERAVFLLHEVFDYPFGEIGMMLEKSPANCRQILHRARAALQEERLRFAPDPQRQRELILGFLAASQAGDMEALTNLLAQDVASWTDGGGNVQTRLLPLHGKPAVARFWSFWLSRASEAHRPVQTISWTFAEINSSPAILWWVEDTLVGVISMTVSADGIQEIDAQLNPEKLIYLQNQLSDSGEPA